MVEVMTKENLITRMVPVSVTRSPEETSSKFVAKEKFVRDTGNDAKVKINYLGDNFTKWFLAGSGKIERPMGKQTLCYGDLKKASVDVPIITELGGAKKAETSLTELFSLMEKQGNGEGGALLTNGWTNIFYIKDMQGVLRAVYVDWNADGWGVLADVVSDPREWNDGYRVFSRNSALKTSEAQKK